MQKKMIEFKAATAAPGTFEGRASVYNFLDYQNDIVLPGAFSTSLAASGSRVKVLNQHDPTDVVGIGTLEDRADALWIKGKLELELESARQAWVRLKAGLIDGLSIGYTVVREQMTREGRLLKELSLHEVSLVTFPANAASRITAVKARGTDRDLQEMLSALRSTRIAIRSDRDRDDAAALKDLLVQLRFKKLDALFSQL